MPTKVYFAKGAATTKMGTQKFIAENQDKNIIIIDCQTGSFTDLTEEELYYIIDKEICNNQPGCECNKIHQIEIHNYSNNNEGINWIMGNKKVFVTIFTNKDVGTI